MKRTLGLLAFSPVKLLKENSIEPMIVDVYTASKLERKYFFINQPIPLKLTLIHKCNPN